MTESAHPPSTSGTRLRDFEPLLPAEVTLLRAVGNGAIAKVSYRRPRIASPALQLRGEFLAFLARGGDAEARVAARRLQIVGAWISGRLDLTGALVPLSVWLFRCSLVNAPIFDGARVLGSLTFSDSALPGLHAEHCRVHGDLALTAGCHVRHDVVLCGSYIGGHFNGERLHALDGLLANDLHVGGDVNLEGLAESAGELRFVAARIGGSFRASGAHLSADVDESGARGVALNLDRMSLGGNLLLNAGFTAAGTVRLERAHIRGDLDGSGAEFDVIGDASWGENGSALRLDRARIDGALILRDLQGPLQGASLVDARVGTLTDDAGSWGQHHVLDGFAYTRFGPGAPTDAPTRLSWLARQRGAHLDADYRPDPWRRLLRALRRGGHAESAAAVAIGRERHLRRIGRIGSDSPRALRWATRSAHAAWGAVAGYGHRPWRLLTAAALVWLACGSIYWAAATRDAMDMNDAPTADCGTSCTGVSPPRAFAYSLEVMLPFAHTPRASRGRFAQDPMAPARDTLSFPPAMRLLTWLEAACGWALALTALAAFMGLGDRDRALS